MNIKPANDNKAPSFLVLEIEMINDCLELSREGYSDEYVKRYHARRIKEIDERYPGFALNMKQISAGPS